MPGARPKRWGSSLRCSAAEEELEGARVYVPDRSLYTGFDLTVCAFDAARFASVKALASRR